MAANPPNVGTGGEIMDTAKTTVKLPFVRSPYNYDLSAASTETAIAPGGPSMTVQAHGEDADLNVLMKRMGLLGQFPVNPKIPMYGDFSEVTDYRTALEAVDKARDAFMEYPADFRAQFDNDPQRFVEYCNNPANVADLAKRGMLAADAKFMKDNPNFAKDGLRLPSANVNVDAPKSSETET